MSSGVVRSVGVIREEGSLKSEGRARERFALKAMLQIDTSPMLAYHQLREILDYVDLHLIGPLDVAMKEARDGQYGLRQPLPPVPQSDHRPAEETLRNTESLQGCLQ